jgi:prepilin-type N-terminal cleavage/methylation domain-containing protein
MSINKLKKEKGFTLIELLVSMTLFSIVLVIILGSIISITDANKKARSLMTVMNNLNFTVDSMTRSFKTGGSPSNILNGFETSEIDYVRNNNGSISPARRVVKYQFVSDGGYLNKIVCNESGNSCVTTQLTSPDIDIQEATFKIVKFTGQDGGDQPALTINIKGEVRITPTVSSEFIVQTVVSQLGLEI